MYNWVFSRLDGAGRATSRNTRMLNSVMALMVPPLPASVAPLEDDYHAQALRLHPFLQMASFPLELAQFLQVLLTLGVCRYRFLISSFAMISSSSPPGRSKAVLDFRFRILDRGQGEPFCSNRKIPNLPFGTGQNRKCK